MDTSYADKKSGYVLKLNYGILWSSMKILWNMNIAIYFMMYVYQNTMVLLSYTTSVLKFRAVSFAAVSLSWFALVPKFTLDLKWWFKTIPKLFIIQN